MASGDDKITMSRADISKLLKENGNDLSKIKVDNINSNRTINNQVNNAFRTKINVRPKPVLNNNSGTSTGPSFQTTSKPAMGASKAKIGSSTGGKHDLSNLSRNVHEDLAEIRLTTANLGHQDLRGAGVTNEMLAAAHRVANQIDKSTISLKDASSISKLKTAVAKAAIDMKELNKNYEFEVKDLIKNYSVIINDVTLSDKVRQKATNDLMRLAGTAKVDTRGIKSFHEAGPTILSDLADRAGNAKLNIKQVQKAAPGAIYTSDIRNQHARPVRHRLNQAARTGARHVGGYVGHHTANVGQGILSSGLSAMGLRGIDQHFGVSENIVGGVIGLGRMAFNRGDKNKNPLSDMIRDRHDNSDIVNAIRGNTSSVDSNSNSASGATSAAGTVKRVIGRGGNSVSSREVVSELNKVNNKLDGIHNLLRKQYNADRHISDDMASTTSETGVGGHGKKEGTGSLLDTIKDVMEAEGALALGKALLPLILPILIPAIVTGFAAKWAKDHDPLDKMTDQDRDQAGKDLQGQSWTNFLTGGLADRQHGIGSQRDTPSTGPTSNPTQDNSLDPPIDPSMGRPMTLHHRKLVNQRDKDDNVIPLPLVNSDTTLPVASQPQGYLHIPDGPSKDIYTSDPTTPGMTNSQFEKPAFTAQAAPIASTPSVGAHVQGNNRTVDSDLENSNPVVRELKSLNSNFKSLLNMLMRALSGGGVSGGGGGGANADGSTPGGGGGQGNTPSAPGQGGGGGTTLTPEQTQQLQGKSDQLGYAQAQANLHGDASTANQIGAQKQAIDNQLSSGGGSNAEASTPGAPGKYRPQYKLTDKDLSDEVVRTIAGEARVKDPKSVDAVINTMFNRVGSKGYGPSSDLSAVAAARGQFAGYNKGRPSAAQAEMIRNRIRAIASGSEPDITHGANEFRTTGYNGPWGQKHAHDGQNIGGNTFARNEKAGGTYSPYAKPKDDAEVQAGGGGGTTASGQSPSGASAGQPSQGTSSVAATGKGSRSWRNNNPGNIEYGKFAKSVGAVGSDGRYAIFPTYGAGRQAQEKLFFEGKNYRNQTLAGAVKTWAPDKENDVPAYLKAMGGNPNTKMKDFTPEQRTQLLNAMQEHEGYKPGAAKAPGTTDGPSQVQGGGGSSGGGGASGNTAPGTTDSSAASSPKVPAGYGSANIPELKNAPGRKPDLTHVDPRLKEILQAAQTHMPAGYKVEVNEGYNPRGHVAGSQHHIAGRGAVDVQIRDPNGNVIPNRGSDPSGMYHMFAKAMNGEMLARHPELKNQLNSGGAFGVTRTDKTKDWMHWDLGGQSKGRGPATKFTQDLGTLDDYGKAAKGDGKTAPSNAATGTEDTSINSPANKRLAARNADPNAPTATKAAANDNTSPAGTTAPGTPGRVTFGGTIDDGTGTTPSRGSHGPIGQASNTNDPTNFRPSHGPIGAQSVDSGAKSVQDQLNSQPKVPDIAGAPTKSSIDGTDQIQSQIAGQGGVPGVPSADTPTNAQLRKMGPEGIPLTNEKSNVIPFGRNSLGRAGLNSSASDPAQRMSVSGMAPAGGIGSDSKYPFGNSNVPLPPSRPSDIGSEIPLPPTRPSDLNSGAGITPSQAVQSTDTTIPTSSNATIGHGGNDPNSAKAFLAGQQTSMNDNIPSLSSTAPIADQAPSNPPPKDDTVTSTGQSGTPTGGGDSGGDSSSSGTPPGAANPKGGSVHHDKSDRKQHIDDVKLAAYQQMMFNNCG